MQWLAIVNPLADHHSTDDLDWLCKQMERRLGAVCTWTTQPGHGTDLVRGNPGYDGYIAVGGDTTIAEVVNGLDGSEACLGIVPAGTGNGLARDLNLSDEATALRVLERSRFAKLDWIKVSFRSQDTWRRRFVVSTSALGYVAGIAEFSNRQKRRWGALSHPLGAVCRCFRQEPFQAQLAFDGEPAVSMDLTSLVVDNTQYIGAFRMFPEARVDDGRLNVLFNCFSPWRQLGEDLQILLQTYLLEKSAHRAAKRLEVVLPQAQTLMLDGTLHDNVSAVVYEVQPAAWTCCIADMT